MLFATLENPTMENAAGRLPDLLSGATSWLPGRLRHQRAASVTLCLQAPFQVLLAADAEVIDHYVRLGVPYVVA